MERERNARLREPTQSFPPETRDEIRRRRQNEPKKVEWIDSGKARNEERSNITPAFPGAIYVREHEAGQHEEQVDADEAAGRQVAQRPARQRHFAEVMKYDGYGCKEPEAGQGFDGRSRDGRGG